MLSHSFPPVAADDAAVLILGSLPGTLSLQRGEYYAKPQNAFWPIMGRCIGAGPVLPYAERLERLCAHRIALWDVCASGFRPGSLDTAIAPASVVANDIAGFLAAHPHIRLICLNGGTAGKLFARHVLPALSPAAQQIHRAALPSTSPAHAAMPFEEKLRRWREALERA